MDATFTFFLPICLFSFYYITFLPMPLAIYLSALLCNFFLYSDYPFTMLLSGKQALLICQASSPCFFKLMLFHTSFIVPSHPLHLISSFLKYLSCLELILLPLILSHQRQTVFAESLVCMWFPTAMGHVSVFFSDKSPTSLGLLVWGLFVIVE